MLPQLKKNIFLSTLPALLFSSTMALASNVSYAQPQSKTMQFGAALEERTPNLDGYLFFNQLIHKKIFYEVRALYLHNYIFATPTTPAGLPPVTSQRNLDGVGGIGIFGYNFEINPNVTAMPFIRFQYITNTIIPPYKDTAGNELDSDSFTSFLGLKLGMKINDVFSIAALYFAGYQTTNLYGKGLFATSTSPKVYSWISIIETDFVYKITPSWIFTPYVQWTTIGNNPNGAALAAPIKQNGATLTTAVYALRLAYAF